MRGLLVWSAVSASLSGLYMGADYGVLNGFFALPIAETYFKSSSDTAKGFIASILIIGGFLSSIFAGYISDRLGRRIAIIIAAFLAIIGGLVQTTAINLSMLYSGRFISGLSMGIAGVAAPLYIAEIAPKQWRGMFVYLVQINFCLGLFISNIFNYGASFIDGNGSFRLMLSVQMMPSLFIIIGMIWSPASPRWLLYKQNDKLARYNLAKLHGIQIDDPKIDEEIIEMLKSMDEERESNKTSWLFVVKNGMWRRLLISFAINGLQKLCGINAIAFFLPVILHDSGITNVSEQLGLSIGKGFANLLGCFVGIFLVDRIGRKTIFTTGGFLMGAAMIAISTLVKTGETSEPSRSRGYWVLAMVTLFVAAFSYSWEPVSRIYMAEIFPQHVRGKAMAASTMFSFACSFIFTQITPMMLTSLGWIAFVFYGIICLLGALWCQLILLETKQKSFQDINAMFAFKHNKSDQVPFNRYVTINSQ